MIEIRRQWTQVEDIFHTKRRGAVLLANVACADQLRYEGIAQHRAQLYECQADLEKLQRLMRSLIDLLEFAEDVRRRATDTASKGAPKVDCELCAN